MYCMDKYIVYDDDDNERLSKSDYKIYLLLLLTIIMSFIRDSAHSGSVAGITESILHTIIIKYLFVGYNKS